MTSDLDHRERADKVSAACRWYRNHLEYIKAMLAEGEIRVPHADNPRGFSLYPPNWCIFYWINKWESQDSRFTLEEAEQMISEQLRPLFPLVRDRMGANPG